MGDGECVLGGEFLVVGEVVVVVVYGLVVGEVVDY